MTTRSEREREQYNSGLQRTLYDKVLKHCNAYSNEYKHKIVLKTISYNGGKINWFSNLDRLG